MHGYIFLPFIVNVPSIFHYLHVEFVCEGFWVKSLPLLLLTALLKSIFMSVRIIIFNGLKMKIEPSS